MRIILLFVLWLCSYGFTNAYAENKLIPPEQAFKLTVAETYGGLDAYWEIAQGYYIYKDKIEFIVETPGIQTTEIEFPEAEIKQDPTFGNVAVYHESFSLTVPLKREGPARNPLELALKVKYQGCADIGLCYPPINKIIKVNLGAEAEELGEPSTPPSDKPNTAPDSTSSNSNSTSSTHDTAPPPQPEPSTLPQTELAEQTAPVSTNKVEPIARSKNAKNALNSEQAFPFEVNAVDKHTVQVNWKVGKGYHLYKNKIKFALEETPSTTSLGEIVYPQGEVINDEFFGRIEVYPRDTSIVIPINYQGNAPSINLVTHYQGCSNENGVCYPPQTIRSTIDLAATTIPELSSVKPVSQLAAPLPSPSAAETEAEEVSSLLETRNFLGVLTGFFLMGLALVFTPCIFPMIPILSGIIAGSGNISSRKAFLLSLVYILASATAYAFIGVMFGFFGENIQATLQHPAVISAFAALFVLLSLSMFGFYDLQMPASIQSRLSEVSNRQQGGSFLGAAIMGFLSTLIVGPCTGPVLTGALTYIADSHDAVLGGAALFTMGFAMGLPLLVVGTSAGHLMPRAGAWMDTTKAIFGIMMLGMAIFMLQRIVPYEVTMALTSILLITSGIYMGALDKLHEEINGWDRFWKSIGLIIFLYGLLILFGVASGSQNLLQPLKGIFNMAPTGLIMQPTNLAFKDIKNLDELELALGEASANKKIVMLDFTAKWCIECKRMEANVFSAPEIIQAAKGLVLLKADVTDETESNRAFQDAFKVIGPPTILFFGPDGLESAEHRITGYMPPERFLAHLDNLKKAMRQ